MRRLAKIQIATYLTKSDKLIDEICHSVYKVTCNPTKPDEDIAEDWNYVRDILVGIVHQQQATKLIEAETLFVQARVIQDAEGDNRVRDIMEGNKKFAEGDKDEFFKDPPLSPNETEIVGDIPEGKVREGHSGHLMEGSDIDRVTNYSRTYCSNHHCEDRDITDATEGDNDEFFCGTLDCPNRIPG